MRTVRTLKLLAPLALISVLSLSWTFAKTADPVVEVPVKTLEPTPQHTSLDQTIAKLLSQHHYRQSKLDDRLSALILNTYLDDLDFGRVYFLAGDIAEKMRERDEVHIHREQHELDGHQQHDQVLPIEEDSDHADREQDRAQDEVMGKRRHL